MRPTLPLTSVIVPVFNGAAYLAEAIDSVVQQDNGTLEIIVVDDGSTDGSAQIVHGCAAQGKTPVRYVYQENAGPAAARNRGLSICQGEIVAFQDADDLWAEGRLSRQLALLNDDPPVDIVLGQVQFFALKSDQTAVPTMEYLGSPRRFPIMHSAMYRRSVFERVGMLNADMRYHEDIEWFLRAKNAKASLRLHDDVVLYYRRHAGNMTNDHIQLQRAWIPFLRRLRQERLEQTEPLWAWLTASK